MSKNKVDGREEDELEELLGALVARVRSREPTGANSPVEAYHHPTSRPGNAMYSNTAEHLGIDFQVERLPLPDQQTLDPRLVQIQPGKTNEYHRHAHESLFVVLSGRGDLRIGDDLLPLRQGDLAFVPRWFFHQARNTSETEPLRLLVITDFGFTRAVLGDYDRRTRLTKSGEDVRES